MLNVYVFHALDENSNIAERSSRLNTKLNYFEKLFK